MKLVTAVIKPSRLDPVLEALKDAGVAGMTVTEVRGFGRQKGKTEVYRGAEYEVKLLPKVKIEVVVSAEAAEAVATALADAAKTGKIGDGKIWIADLESVHRIRTGERDLQAIEG
ncbi:MAG: P-II family nitrogen regulator [Hyphomonadaceae bacterium]